MISRVAGKVVQQRERRGIRPLEVLDAQKGRLGFGTSREPQEDTLEQKAPSGFWISIAECDPVELARGDERLDHRLYTRHALHITVPSLENGPIPSVDAREDPAHLIQEK